MIAFQRIKQKPMDPEWKAKWVEALRSGKYKQGQYKLRDEDQFCCLGVLCDLVDNTAWSVRDFHEAYDEVPSQRIGKVVGFKEMEPYIYDTNPDVGLSGDEGTITLAQLNDAGATFAEIADIIEEVL